MMLEGEIILIDMIVVSSYLIIVKLINDETGRNESIIVILLS